jgi:hypothetical protein
MTYKNYPIEECARGVADLLDRRPGSAFFQKWTCGGCGRRITGNTPNKLFTEGHCEECGHITDLKKTGCNYMVHMVVGGIADMPHKGSA